MKKLIPVMVALLLLVGCTAAPEETTAPPTTEPVKGIYVPQSQLEADTDGAIRVYQPEEPGFRSLAKVGTKLLLMGSDGRMATFTGQELLPEAVYEADTPLQTVTAGSVGVAYYLESTRQVICLNPMLTQVNTVQLPEGAEGTPAICLETDQVFYCVEKELRALDMQTGISRMVRSYTDQALAVTEVLFGGKVLVCLATDEAGAERVLYLSAETGQTLYENTGIEAIQTEGESYFLSRMDGVTHQYVFGTRTGQAKQLLLTGSVLGLPAIHSALRWSAGEQGLALELYDLEKGVQTAAVTVPGLEAPGQVLAEADTGDIWLLTESGLFCWDPSKSPVTDSTLCTGPLYTAENPDAEGLAALQSRVDGLNEQYGIRLAIWEDAVKLTGDYVLTPEYQTGVIGKALDQLEKALASYPLDIFTESMRQGQIRIHLVRAIGGGETSVHYWQDKDACLALTVDSVIEQELLRQIAYAIDSHTVAYSKNYDLWNKLNPEGFQYDLDYGVSQQRDDEQYLTGEGRAFVDKKSMSFATEDRCSILLAACQPENEELFAAPILQKKLYEICTAIREAYALEKYAEPLPWETYLTEPLVP